MPGSATTRGRSCARVGAHARVAFRRDEGVGTPKDIFAAQWLAYAFPCRRFALGVAANDARLGADAVRYSFIVVDFHHLLLTGLPAHRPICYWMPDSIRPPPPMRTATLLILAALSSLEVTHLHNGIAFTN